jgi:EAL domain-containing protein (putative c-di-GMP-specific phosphodiesterase class I)
MPFTRFEVEVTETSLVGDVGRAQKTLERLAAAGVRITLDDFGTGYASIGFLRQLPFQGLKIDKTLIGSSLRDDHARAMMVACVATAKALGMEVTAEGIETVELAALARAAGCDLLQGWHLARAVDAADLAELVSVARDQSARKTA